MATSRKISVKPTSLILVYSILPVALVLIVFDHFILDEAFRTGAPTDPNEFIWFTILFTMPHILASFFGFFDTEYRKFYGKKMLQGAQLSFLAIALLPIISVDLAFYVFAIFTMTHVLFQQSGIAKSLMKSSSKYHTVWQWTGVIISSIFYFDIYSDFSMNSSLFVVIILVLTVILFTAALMAVKKSKTKIGKAYFWSTHTMIAVSGLCFLAGYPILVIAIPRVVHDVTAYMYYTAHDHNRFLDTQSNKIYSLTKRFGLPVIVVSPLLSLFLAGLFQINPIEGATIPLVSFIVLMHYHTESYIWKKTSLHRKYINYAG